MKDKEKYYTNLSIMSDHFQLVVNVNITSSGDITTHLVNGKPFGFIETCVKSSVIWDGLGWFYDIDGAKKKELKEELKSLGIYEKGMIKDLKKLINYGKEISLLTELPNSNQKGVCEQSVGQSKESVLNLFPRTK